MISLAIGLAIFVQSFVGFGFALISMPLITPALGLKVSAPLIALLGGTAELILLVGLREAVTLGEMGTLTLASLFGTALGILALRHVPETLLLPVLGLILLGYALYNLLRFRLPPLRAAFWPWLLGGLAGALGGAYNTSGPPVILYGHARGWEPDQFKGNLQGFFFVNNLFVLTGHWLGGLLTAEVWRLYLQALPALLLGIVGGLWLGRRIPARQFRQVVLIGLALLGLRLLF